jgi:hypothetical protein
MGCFAGRRARLRIRSFATLVFHALLRGGVARMTGAERLSERRYECGAGIRTSPRLPSPRLRFQLSPHSNRFTSTHRRSDEYVAARTIPYRLTDIA